MKKLEKIKNIEFLRFVFVLMIVFAHIIEFCIRRTGLYADYEVYTKYWGPVIDAFLCVDYFFIVSGFFLFFHFKNKQDSTLEFAVNKIIRFWPLLAFSIILFGVLSLFHICKFYSYGNIISLFFLYTVFAEPMGIAVNNGASWFICQLFWISLFLHYSYKTLSQRMFNIIMFLIIFFSFTVILHFNSGTIPGVQMQVFGCVPGAVLRALATICLGYFVGMLWANISDYVKNFQIKNKLKSALFFISVSALEIYLFVFLINNSIFHKIHFNNDLLFIIIFCSLFILFLCRKGLLSKLLENNISVFLGKFSFAIYIMQGVGLAIEKHFMWTNKAFVYAHPYINIWISILICVVIGVLSHIFVEKKAVKAFNVLIVKTRSTSGLSGGGVGSICCPENIFALRLISPCVV